MLSLFDHRIGDLEYRVYNEDCHSLEAVDIVTRTLFVAHPTSQVLRFNVYSLTNLA